MEELIRKISVDNNEITDGSQTEAIKKPIKNFEEEKDKIPEISEGKTSEKSQSKGIADKIKRTEICENELLEKIDDYIDTKSPQKFTDIVKTSILDGYEWVEIKPIKKSEKISVYLIQLNDGNKYALKCISLDFDRNNLSVMSKTKNRLDQILREYHIAHILASVYPSIANYYDLKVKISDLEKKIFVETFLEYLGPSLEEVYKEISVKNSLNIMAQLVNSLVLLEKIGICHSDIKPENIVYNSDSKVIKIIDFGSSLSFNSSLEKIISRTYEKTSSDSLIYAPPELLEPIKANETHKSDIKLIPSKIDVYCWGMTFYQMICRSNFSSELVNDETREFLKARHSNILSKLENSEYAKFKKIISKCLDFMPENRPTFKEIQAELDLVLKESEFIDIISPQTSYKSDIDIIQIAEMFDKIDEQEAAIYMLRNHIKKITNEDRLTRSKIISAKHYYKTEDIKMAIQYLTDIENKVLTSKQKFTIYYYLGKSYDKLNVRKKALEYYEKAYISISDIKDENIKLFPICNSLGYIHAINENYDQAIKFYIQALEIRSKIFSQDDKFTALTYDNLALLYLGKSDFSNSINYYTKAISIYKNINIDLSDKKNTNIYKKLAYAYFFYGKYEDAINAFQAALEFYKKIFDNNEPLKIAKTLSNLALCYYHLGKYKKAMSCLYDSLSLFENNPDGKKHKSFPQILNYAGLINNYLKNHEKSIEYFHESINSYIEMFGEEYIKMAEPYRNLGLIFLQQEKYLNAIECLTKAQKIVLTKYNPDHILFEKLYFDLGLANLKAKQFADSIDNLTKFHDIYQQKTVKDDSLLLKSYYFQGLAFLGIKNYSQACVSFTNSFEISEKINSDNYAFLIKLYKKLCEVYKALDIFKEPIYFYVKLINLMEKHSDKYQDDLAESYNEFGIFYDKTGRYTLALEQYTKASNLLKKNYGEGYIELSKIYNNQGAVYTAMRSFKLSIMCYTESLNILKKTFDEGYIGLASVYNNLGLAYEKLENHDKAISYFHKSLALKLKAFGGLDEELSSLYNNLSLSYAAQEKYAEAIEYSKKALEIVIKEKGRDHSNAHLISNNLASYYSDIKDYDNAIKILEEILEANAKKFGKHFFNFAPIYNNLAIAYFIREKYDSARVNFIKCREILEKSLQPTHPEFITLNKSIATTYLKLKMPEKAKEYDQFTF